MKAMKLIFLAFVGTFVVAFEVTAGKGSSSLEIKSPLHNQTHVEGKQVRLICEVENATEYRWYHNGKLLSQGDHNAISIEDGYLKIFYFMRKHAGAYECEGRDQNGNYGKTTAEIKHEDKSCGRQKEPETECVIFDEHDCPRITSLAPKAEDLFLQLQFDYETYQSYVYVKWGVPKAGRESIWGWQIRIIGKEGVPGYSRCYQVNIPKDVYATSEEIFEEKVFPVELAATFTVEVQGYPGFLKQSYSDTVVRKDISVPGLCDIVTMPACCETFVNVSLASDKHDRMTLLWETNYPANLRVVIDGFQITWISNPDDSCNAKSVFLDSQKSNYTFQHLTPACGNYTIKLEVKFANKEKLKCSSSPPVIIWHTPFPESDVVTTKSFPRRASNVVTTKSFTRRASNVVTTAGFAVAACLAGLLIVALIVLRKKIKGFTKKSKHICAPESRGDKVNVFILNPNHCDLCTDVIQTLGSLLIETGHIDCQIDMFVPMTQKGQGLARWTEDMIMKSDYVIIPWMSEINPPTQAKTVMDMNTLLFISSLEIIRGELLRNPNKKEKFIPVYLDHCSIEILPANHLLLPTYNIPSRIDDLVVELLGKTRRRPDPEWPILEFDDKNYIAAKRNLEQAVYRMKKRHPDSQNWQKNSHSGTRKEIVMPSELE